MLAGNCSRPGPISTGARHGGWTMADGSRAACRNDTAPSALGEPQPTPPEMTGRSATILLVDDHELFRSVTAELLERIGYQVIAVAHPATALDLLATEPDIDLLLTDLVMPGPMDGLALIEAARSLRPSLKVLLATGHADANATTPRRLTKPFRQNDLARMVRDVLAG